MNNLGQDQNGETARIYLLQAGCTSERSCVITDNLNRDFRDRRFEFRKYSYKSPFGEYSTELFNPWEIVVRAPRSEFTELTFLDNDSRVIAREEIPLSFVNQLLAVHDSRLNEFLEKSEQITRRYHQELKDLGSKPTIIDTLSAYKKR